MKLPQFSSKDLGGLVLIIIGISLLVIFSGTLFIRVLGIVAGVILINKGLTCNNKPSLLCTIKSWLNKF